MGRKQQGELYEPSGHVYWYRGQRKGPRAWSRTAYCKVSYTVLMQRVGKGWKFSDAMETPPGQNNPALSRKWTRPPVHIE
jgi:hypothetical protein